MSVLYIVATPIGNLEDITIRALRVLKEVDLIAAEDTRVTRKLLRKHDIHTKTTSYNDHNKTTKLPFILNVLSEKSVALDSDIGNVKINLNKFSELVEKITKQNSFRPYPDINDIPN